ncbi:hypothetical protein BC939DRAFT_444158 [Gamsiella multidivaricata]|uniref:uncharacterized protein n=1 Tax=Gamsiella multidivaricata TaxID=101098 RepID=UPI00221E9920|nr:uncharacterized protein BC939DRAFT_444158 [Gamsiella multidivaricata]KAI7827955.1 hypothetical protein BC939DRAFT_444158 [Gamsiella multidivaricata]
MEPPHRIGRYISHTPLYLSPLHIPCQRTRVPSTPPSMQSGNSRNPQHDRPDDGGMANAKKLKPTGGAIEPSQPVRVAETTTSAALSNPGGPSGTAPPPSTALIYSSKIGLKAMHAKQHQDVAEAAAMEDKTMEQEAQEDWIEVQRARDRFFAASIHLDNIHSDTAAENKSELQDILLRAPVV